MREAVMSAGLLGIADGGRAREHVATDIKEVRPAVGWNPEDFAREQILRLVRQIFTPRASEPKRQIVFSAAEPETDIRAICMRVAEVLAEETLEDVAVLGAFPEASDTSFHPEPDFGGRSRYTPLRAIARHVRRNLWVIPVAEGEPHTTAFLHTYLGEVRREFAYSIVHGRSAGESNEAAAMAQCADGIILVLSARRTRRAVASKIRQAFEQAQVRLLGTVLSDREFPIPEGVYRRL